MAHAVLLVDDNAVQAGVRQVILKRSGFQVYAALSAERALEQLQAHEFPVPIGLVLTDHIMPGMNGSEFVRRLRTLEPNLPVLVVSGLDEAEAEYAGLNILFRTKPLLPDQLLALVHRLLPGHGEQDEHLDRPAIPA